MAVTDFY